MEAPKPIPETIQFGSFAPSLTEQLAGLAPEKQIKAWQQDAICISHLYFSGLLTKGERNKLRDKLTRSIGRALHSSSDGRTA